MAAGTEGKWSELISTLYHVSQIKNGEIETEVRGENLSPVVIRELVSLLKLQIASTP